MSYLGRMVLFSCPVSLEKFNQPAGVLIERVGAAKISPEDYERILDVWNPVVRARQIEDRFEVGCELWLAKCDGRVAGFVWTIRGRTVRPHFFPLQFDEVHVFDGFVFPEFRGRGIIVILIMNVLAQLSGEQIHRAHCECAAWNNAPVRSLTKTPFRRYAEATQLKLLGHSVVVWH